MVRLLELIAINRGDAASVGSDRGRRRVSDGASASEAVPEGAQGLFSPRHHLMAQLQLLPRQGRRTSKWLSLS